MPKLKSITLSGEISPELHVCFGTFSKLKVKGELPRDIVDRFLGLCEAPQ